MDSMKFEVPADMRKFAEQSVESARQAFDRFIAAAHEAVTDFEGRAQAAKSGAMDVGGRAMSFAERNMAASFEFAQKLVKARDVEEVIRLQTDYVKAQIQALNDQTRELAEAAAQVAKETASTNKPL
jgi:phasin